jgi:uncharacterized protein YciI
MEFDHFTVALLLLRPDAPELDEGAATALQDDHLAHLAEMHDAGQLLAAGPVPGPPDQELRGVSIFTVGVDEARRLAERDPAVRAGRFQVDLYPWMVPAGAISFSATRFPRSTAEARG